MKAKPNYVVVNFSGGKDSTAMLLGMLEKGERIDEVMNCDTYKEFPEMYRHIEKNKKPLRVPRNKIHNTSESSNLRLPYV